MRSILAILAIAATSVAALAADDSNSPRTLQQNKMVTCNQQAGDMKGDDRKAFMSSCLSNQPETPQMRMGRCNKEAAGMAGDARKSFMSSCLSTQQPTTHSSMTAAPMPAGPSASGGGAGR